MSYDNNIRYDLKHQIINIKIHEHIYVFKNKLNKFFIFNYTNVFN